MTQPKILLPPVERRSQIIRSMKRQSFTVLVAEDNEDDRFLIKHALRKAGTKGPIQLVTSGDEAIAYMKGEGKFADRTQYEYPSFVVTDLKMSPGDGFHVLEHLKNNPDSAIIPAVVVSGSCDTDDIKRSYLLGASSFHEKPAN